MFSRRLFLRAAAGGGIASPFMFYPGIARAANVTRYDLSSPEGNAMLKIYADAVGKMALRASGDPTGWLFQWYTHAVRDDRTKSGEIARIYPNNPTGPRRLLAKSVWNTCEAHFGGQREDFFLPWHRIYLHFFEEIIRAVSGRPEFTLPYWDYTNPGKRVLPVEFRSPNSATWAPLHRQRRKPAVNSGQRIDLLSGASDINADCLRSRAYGDIGSDAGFNSNLDQNPHGSIHVDIGNDRGMGAIPWAANDPIFWVHHCNVDRLWASWNKAGGVNLSDAAFLNQAFAFANGSGLKGSMQVKDVMTTDQLSYDYQTYVPRPTGSPPFSATSLVAAAPSVHAAPAVSEPVALGAAASVVKLALQPIASMTAAANTSVAAQVEALESSKSVFLRLDNVTADAQPGISYDVHLDPAPGRAPTRDDISYAGNLNFFGVAPHAGHEDHGGGTGPSRNYSFQVSDVIAKLKAAGQLATVPSVSLVPSGKLAEESAPMIGKISLVSG